VLIATVLLQPGKTDAGALFTSNVSSAAFGPRGTASVLSKITIIAAATFMVLAFLISLPALQGGVSVLQSVGEEAPAAAPEAAPAVIEADSNTAVETVPVPDANASNSAQAPVANTDSEAAGEEPPANR
jgi:protein translocase SecG subunit